MQHHFTVEVAKEYGINCAVLLDNFVYWQKENEANRRNYHDGRYWSYNTIKAFTEMFPYLSTQNIRTAIQKLLKAELIVSGEFADDPYDHTKWYSVTEKGMRFYQIDMSESTILESLTPTSRIVSSNKSTIIQIENNTDNKQHIDKHPYGEFDNVLLTDDELRKLREKFPSSWEEKIENLSQYMASKGKAYKSHYATILNWDRKNTKSSEPTYRDIGVIRE